MNSFAIWYEGEKDNINVDLHFNLWKLKNESWKINKIENSNMFLDIGIKVQDINDIKNIFIFIPFCVTDKNIEDMGIRMKDNRKLINGIFNDDCEIKNNGGKDGVTITRNNGDDTIKIHTLDYEYQNNIRVEKKENGSIICIVTEKDNAESGEEKDKDSNYYRFRIKGKSVYDFGSIKKEVDNPFRTSCEKNHIIDFRVNEKRALPENLNMLLQKEKLFNINVIHFLLLTDTSYKLACTGLNYTMRALEDDLWKDYIDRDYERGSLVGYHWKESAKDRKSIENFNSYIRIKETKVNLITIIIYILVFIMIGLATNLLSSLLPKMDNYSTIASITCIVIGIIILCFCNKRV